MYTLVDVHAAHGVTELINIIGDSPQAGTKEEVRRAAEAKLQYEGLISKQ